jgi:hypothetical protein
MDLPTELLEHLAAIEHNRWADWQRHLHERCTRNSDGTLTIPAGLAARWDRQIATPYADLSEPEKQLDRDQVARYWPIIDTSPDLLAEHEKAVREHCATELLEWAKAISGPRASRRRAIESAAQHISPEPCMTGGQPAAGRER